ncbi:MAG: glycosyltransferase family 4 protein, partial [Deltaproteobacteria bacterium]
ADQRKILVATFGGIPDATGASSRLTEFLRGLTPIFAVDALSVKPEALAHIERYYGARLMRVPMLKRDLASRAQTFERAVRRQIESDDYELVHVTDPFAGYPALQRRAQAGYKVVYDAHSLPSLEWQLTAPEALLELRFSTRLRRIERHCLLAADRVLAGSEAMRGYLSMLGVPADRLRVVPPPIETREFLETPPPSDAEGLRLAYLGSCAPWEGIEPVLRALRLARDRGLRVRLELGGPIGGAGRRLLRDVLASQKLADAVIATGPVGREQLRELFERSHALIAPFAAPLPIGPIGLGTMKLGEYLAGGRPVLCADTPVHRELASQEGGALFYRPGDAAALADAMGQLMDPGRRKALGDQARRRARQALDAGLSRRALLQTYYDLLDPSVVVAPDVFAVQDRTGAHEGDGPTTTLEGLDDRAAALDPDTNPEGAVEPVTGILRFEPPPTTNPSAVSSALTSQVLLPLAGLDEPPPPPVAAPVAPPVAAPPEGQAPPPAQADEDWFSPFLPEGERQP